MEHLRSEVNRSPDSALTPKDRRKSLAPRTLVARALLILGLVLLAVYVTARIQARVMSRVAVRQFEELKQPSPDSAVSATAESTEPPRTMSQPDFLLWSKKRIKGFQDSLTLSLAPPMGVLRIPRLHLEVPLLEGTESAGLNRHIVGDARALRERSSDSILALSLAPAVARRQAKRRQRHRWAGY